MISIEAQEKAGGVVLRVLLPPGDYNGQGLTLVCEDGKWKAASEAQTPTLEEEPRFVAPLGLDGPPQRVRRKSNG